jgi:serine protease Do
MTNRWSPGVNSMKSLSATLPERRSRCWWSATVSRGCATQLAQFFGVAGGLLVTHVLSDSPAAAAGLRSGDVIVRVDGQPVRRSHDLSAVILQSLSQQREAPVTVEIIRERQAQQLLLTLPLPPPKL